MIEIPKQAPVLTIKEMMRLNYGPGIAGAEAFRMIVEVGIFCDGKKEDGAKCGNIANQTVDFDVPRVNSLAQIPTCNDCRPQIVSEVYTTCVNKYGVTPSFGINGRGRS